eukprot:sb/3471214/
MGTVEESPKCSLNPWPILKFVLVWFESDPGYCLNGASLHQYISSCDGMIRFKGIWYLLQDDIPSFTGPCHGTNNHITKLNTQFSQSIPRALRLFPPQLSQDSLLISRFVYILSVSDQKQLPPNFGLFGGHNVVWGTGFTKRGGFTVIPIAVPHWPFSALGGEERATKEGGSAENGNSFHSDPERLGRS